MWLHQIVRWMHLHSQFAYHEMGIGVFFLFACLCICCLFPHECVCNQGCCHCEWQLPDVTYTVDISALIFASNRWSGNGPLLRMDVFKLIRTLQACKLCILSKFTLTNPQPYSSWLNCLQHRAHFGISTQSLCFMQSAMTCNHNKWHSGLGPELGLRPEVVLLDSQWPSQIHNLKTNHGQGRCKMVCCNHKSLNNCSYFESSGDQDFL